jgi:hypothetical protein
MVSKKQTPIASRAWLIIRWWFGLSWLISGLYGIITGPILLLTRNDGGGIYFFVGGLVLLLAGWAFLPWSILHPRLNK